jgi:hypothetical protein
LIFPSRRRRAFAGHDDAFFLQALPQKRDEKLCRTRNRQIISEGLSPTGHRAGNFQNVLIEVFFTIKSRFVPAAAVVQRFVMRIKVLNGCI